MKTLTINTTTTAITSDPVVACIGYFDGFHIGHQTLFNKTIALAHQHNAKSAIITFDPDPWVILKGLHNVQHLTTLEDRQALAKAKGFDYWIALQFDETMAAQDPMDFIDLLVRNNLIHLVCGYDFRFGHRGKGSAETLTSQSKLPTSVLEEFEYQDAKVSTTRIIAAIKDGNLGLASVLLGQPYAIKGTVVHGKRIGTQIGFPTANLKVDPEYVIPKMGVYAGLVTVDGRDYGAMISIGYNPTVKDDDAVSIEAHLFDFNANLYGKTLTYRFVAYLRPEMKYTGLELLIEQLKRDELASRAVLKEITY
jgi:riboflavin kinase / FMN adenylyltransferase